MPGADPGESAAARRVLAEIVERGPVTAADIATALGVTPTAVRRHTDALLEAGLVADGPAIRTTRGRGRPARAFVVTDTGHACLADSGGDVAVEALRFLARTYGETAVAAFADDYAARREGVYAQVMRQAGDGVADQVTALAGALSADGYAASVRPVTGPAGQVTGVQLCQGHCPKQRVAVEHPQLCEAEREMFARLLGVDVQRLATLAHGEHVCTTFIRIPDERSMT